MEDNSPSSSAEIRAAKPQKRSGAYFRKRRKMLEQRYATKGEKVVYFMQVGDHGPVKIGTTHFGLIERRRQALQTGNHEPIRVLAVVPGGESHECELHRQFAPLRRTGEWFDPGPELLDYVASLDEESLLPASPVIPRARATIRRGDGTVITIDGAAVDVERIVVAISGVAPAEGLRKP